MPVPHTAPLSPPVRVFISYAHDNPENEAHVHQLWVFLRNQRIDAQLDKLAAEQPQDWAIWMLQQIRAARFVLIIASPEYRRRAEGEVLPASINDTWPLARVQTCVVHLVRNSLKYASKKYWPQITKALRAVYASATIDAAETRFAEFEQEWGAKYPAIVKLWQAAWSEFIPFLQYPLPIRKVIYTTNLIESLNARFRQATRRRGHFPTEAVALKVLYLVIRNKPHNRPHITGKTTGWKEIINTLAAEYGERITANQTN